MTDPRHDLIDAARYFHQRNWMLGTGGNLSARLDDGSFWITASGRSKGQLSLHDFVQVFPDGQWNPAAIGGKPSAETSIHQAIYHCFPEMTACYHVHSIEANLISKWFETDAFDLPSLEMLKGLGVWEEHPQAKMPLFDNPLNVEQIGQAIRDRFAVQPPKIPALLIRDHGVTVWATSTEQARNAIELAEYLFQFMVLERQTRR